MPVTNLRHLGQLAGALVFLLVCAQLFDLFLALADGADGIFLRLPSRFAAARVFFQLGQFPVDLFAALFRVCVLFLQQRLALDFQLQNAALNLVDLHGQRIDLHAQAGRRFIDQVNSFVWQEAVGDVAVRKSSGSENRGVLDAHAVMHFIALF